MVEVQKKDRETSEGLVRRFSRQLQQSGVLPHARKLRFRLKKKTRRQLREEAMYKEKVRNEVEKMKKMGIFDEEKLKDIKKKISAKQ
ncbi:MAG: hypothetical protein U9M90_04455 [Patescibacteria group bacterium]|nr:hypothetical protein [Patescibacteria group bacterium]